MTSTTSSLYSIENPVYASFCFYAAVLTLKTLCMAFLTGFNRISKRAFANPECAKMANGKVKTDEDVERVRRAHLNDLENILPFLILGTIFIGMDPGLAWAKLLFRTFTVARFIHTFVYAIVVIPQPARAISFMVGMLVNLLMAFSIIFATCSSGM